MCPNIRERQPFCQSVPNGVQSNGGRRITAGGTGLPMNGSKEQTAKGSLFMQTTKRNHVKFHITEPFRHNQNCAETAIRELKRKWFCTMIRQRVPRRFWDYSLKWCAQVMSRTSNSVFSLNGRVPIERVTGETVDVSEYIDMSFYDWVHFIEGE